MKTVLMMVGKTTDKRFTQAIDDYVGRIQHYLPFDVDIVPEPKQTRSLTEEQQKQMEGEQILRRLTPADTVILLDEHGKEPRSLEFADLLRHHQQQARRLVFVIGGPYGFSADVYRRANQQLSLSRMTFSHQMVRLIFAEQLYRACTIIRGEPYHHE